MNFECSVEIAGDPQRVFAFLTRPELVKTWQLDLPEPPPLPPGGLHIGLRQRAIVEEYGRRFEIETVVVDFNPDCTIAYEMDSPNAVVLTQYHLSQRPVSTTLRQTVTFTPRRWMRFVWPMVQGVFRKKVRSRLRLLKE